MACLDLPNKSSLKTVTMFALGVDLDRDVVARALEDMALNVLCLD